MKATGIIRRVDDLGRVVIPKEIRRTMGIEEGDPLEIFVDEGSITFKPYMMIDRLKINKMERNIILDALSKVEYDGTEDLRKKIKRLDLD